MNRLSRTLAQMNPPPPYLRVAKEVQEALDAQLPVVALESTIISHGMPYPQNYETAKQVEQVARDLGVIPATIGILDGVVCIGMSDAELNKLATLGHKCHKCSRRDLGVIIAQKENGATTVAATMYLAQLVGIRVFVTGGIGGVHRGVEETMDVSADLTELSRTPVAVICAGVKSILDIPKTLEYLETGGVPVISYGLPTFLPLFSLFSSYYLSFSYALFIPPNCRNQRVSRVLHSQERLRGAHRARQPATMRTDHQQPLTARPRLGPRHCSAHP